MGTPPSSPRPLHAEPLLTLGRRLRAGGYRHVTGSPATHARVLARAPERLAATERDVLGWSLPFAAGRFDGLEQLLDQAGALVREGERCRSLLRASTLGGQLYFHSAYPTLAADSVFFGPDTYRFAALLDREVAAARRAVDVGCGSGAGGLCLGGRVGALVLADVNPRALALARVNAALQDRAVEVVESDVLAGVEGPLDLVIANPPYLVDAAGRAYRDGGGPQGTALSLRIAEQALRRLRGGGRLILYTATPIEDGEDPLRAQLVPLLEAEGARWRYQELDVDVWGEELEGEAYRKAERIALIGLVADIGTSPLVPGLRGNG